MAATKSLAAEVTHLAERRNAVERRQLRALLDAAEETASSLEIDEILRRVCDRARELCHADSAAIALLDEGGTKLLTATRTGAGAAAEMDTQARSPVPLSQDALAREALASGGAVHVPDCRHDSRAEGCFHYADATGFPAGALTVVPLIFHARRIGLLSVAWTRRHRELGPAERELLEALARQASVAIENARLFAAISRRTEQFKALVDLSVRAGSETDPRGVIRAATEAAAKLLAADRASLRLYDEKQNLLVPAWTVGYSQLIRREHLMRRPGEGTPGRAFLERRAVVESRYSEPELADGRPEHVGLHSSLSVPLMARGRPIGVLNVGSLRARQFDDEDAELLQLFANQAALAIDNARLLESETDQARRLEVLFENAKMLTSSLEQSQLLESMTAAVARLTGATYCACYLVDEETGELCYVAGRTRHPELWRDLRLGAGQGIVGAAVERGQAILVPDIREDPRAARTDLDDAESLRAVVYAPLRTRGKVIGALGAGRPEPDSFGQNDLKLLSAFADLAASAIANARLYDRTESDLRHLNSLRDVVESISSELDLTPLLDKVVRHAVELLEADGGTVSLVNPATGLGRLKSVYGLSPDLIDAELPAGTGLVGLVLAQRTPVVVDRYADVPQPFKHHSLDVLRAGIAVPIWRQEALIGVFAIFSQDPARRFKQEDVETLTTFAKHAAIAIENARLYEHSQQAAVTEERNRLAREIHDTLAQRLTGIILQLEIADMSLEGGLYEDNGGAAHVQRALAMAREGLEEARRSMLDLRAEALEGRSLPDALEHLIGEFSRDSGIRARFVGCDTCERFPARVESGLYRIAQEALANVRKHAGASQVEVELMPSGDHLWLKIADDGHGFDRDDVARKRAMSGRFGLQGMRERAALLGGQLMVESRPGDGTRVEVKVPMTGQGMRLPRR